jgi:acyl carrier protein
MELEKIINVIKSEVQALAGKELNDTDEDVFFKSNFIDSLNLLNIIIFLEQKFDLKIDMFFQDRESVSSVNKLAQAIKRQLEASK